ncbi:uncharacterized protein LOC119680674 [Teleopsis dalmanni]|uniref:uncharacterized protein LOC119680674 n=1 Tax=Teleopsis dalmanni TaxID=139649 RepID=UPI0018CD68C4|nr:uncharacterized protein LOC119680674 [Teleopsis dalmanni]
MRVTKSDITLELECWIDDLSAAQLAAYEKVANEHNAIKNALKSALSNNEGKEIFNGQVFQAYSFKGKVLQELKEATVPKKQPKSEPAPTPPPTVGTRGGRKRPPNFVFLESSDEEEDNIPLAKRVAITSTKKSTTSTSNSASTSKTAINTRQKAATTSTSGKGSPQLNKSTVDKKAANSKSEKASTNSIPASGFRPSESTSVGGLVVGSETKNGKDSKDNKETKLQGKTFPSLVVLARPWLKAKDMSATRSKLDSKVKLVLMLTPNKFTEWLIQEGLLKAEQKCESHQTSELKLGVYSDASKFPYTGGYVWISECCPTRFISVFHGSIFEGAPHPPSCILKLIYHWSCQTNIQNVVQWVKVDNVYIKGVYTWLRAVCTLAVHQKSKKLGGPEKFVEVGVISLGTTSQDGQQRQVKVEVLGVLDFTDKTIRLRAVEPVSDADRNYKKRFQTILEPLQRWVDKDSIISIDLTVDKMTLHSMGFKNIVQAAATDTSAKHNNSAVMDYLRHIVPRMFQNTLSLLSRQMIQQFLDELVWREQFGTYALQAFNNITAHIAEQTRMNTNETLTQRLYQVATNPFKDWSPLPPNFKDTPANNTPKRLKKPINEADYMQPEKEKEKPAIKISKKEKERVPTPTPATSKRRSAAIAAQASFEEKPDKHEKPEKKVTTQKSTTGVKTTQSKNTPTTKASVVASKKAPIEIKTIKKEDDDLRGLEEMYYGVRDGNDENFESFPYTTLNNGVVSTASTEVQCSICDTKETFDSNEKLQTHIVSHINLDGKDHQFQCLFCLDKSPTEAVLAKHSQLMHPTETKISSSPSYHCLICQQRHNSLHHLSIHLQKVHNMLELPYNCQACGYRSSSHRDVVRHFYDDHKNQNFLQCPFCLDIFRFSYKGKINMNNIDNYYMHLRQHVSRKEPQMRCQKCALSFINKGALKQHSSNHHVSFTKNPQNVRLLLNNSLLISPPKVRTHHREPQPFTIQKKFGEVCTLIEGSICVECNSEIINDEHYSVFMKCNKCNYKTCCERAIFDHCVGCNGTNGIGDEMELPLPNEMHCICGFSTAIGNKMAHHLATCGQKSAYPTVELAQENTVKRNMLDMLGLVRRDGEGCNDGEDSATAAAIAASTNFQDELQQSFSNIVESDEQEQQEQQQQQIEKQEPQNDNNQTPIQFGETEATPIMESNQGTLTTNDQNYANIVDSTSSLPTTTQSTQYNIGFGQPEVEPHTLGEPDIGMPLIGELQDPNPPATPQFLGEVHTPMFDAAAVAEQQHYNQMMQ